MSHAVFGKKLKAGSLFVVFMPKVESLGIKNLESVNWYVKDLERTRRFYVDQLDFQEIGTTSEELQQKALVQYRGMLETGELRAASDPVLTDPQLSFQLAQALQDLDFLNVLLRNRSEQQRLKQLTDYLARQVPKMKEASRMRKLSPLNGHGTAPSGISG